MSTSTATQDLEALRNHVAGLMPQVRTDLEQMVSIPSINFPGYEKDPVLECAKACAALLQDAGASDVELVTGETGIPTVKAEIAGPPGSPTVLLYSHYDVQPDGNEEKWESPPFEPQERDGRLYGRGAADDKSGVVSHIATVRAFGGKPPVTLRILLEGEEEYGGEFEDWPETRPEVFADVDVAVIADMGNVTISQPTFTTQLRGIVAGTVTIHTLNEPRHSGQFGGPAPDSLMAMIHLLSTLQDEDGHCAIEGITGTEWEGADFPEDAYRELAGVREGVPLIGRGSLASRLYSRPSVTVIGIVAPDVATAPNALIPKTRAKISVRIPAGVDGDEATEALRRHVKAHVPWGLDVEFDPDTAANGSVMRIGGRAYDAFSRAMTTSYGTDPTTQGMGGAVPFVANLIEHAPSIEVLGVGAQDPLARIHAPNESVDLGELENSIFAEALFLSELAATWEG